VVLAIYAESLKKGTLKFSNDNDTDMLWYILILKILSSENRFTVDEVVLVEYN
jgi:hypothetical protein